MLENAFKNATATLSGKVGDIAAALNPTKVDIIVVRKIHFEVPRGRRVNKKMWTALDNDGNRKVTFSPVVEVKLVPSKGECYPTPRSKAACFFSKYHSDIETKRIKSGGADQAGWLLLLSETRLAAAEGRKQQQEEQRQPRTDHGAARQQGNSGLDQIKDERNAVQTGAKQRDGSGGGGVAGSSSVSEASVVPETKPSGWRRSSLLPVGGKDKKRGLFKTAKALGRWVGKFYRVSWTPDNGGADSCLDWVLDFPAGSQYNIV